MRATRFQKYYVLLHVIIFIWGFTAVLGALISLDALNLTFYRLAVAWVLLAAYAAIRRIPLLAFKIYEYKSFAFNGFLIGLHWLLFFAAVKTGGVSVTLVALSSGAFFTGFLEPLIHKRKVSVYEIAAGLAVIGIMYFIFQVGRVSWTAVFYGMAAAFMGSLFSVLNARLIQHYPAVSLSFWELFFAWIVVGILTAVTRRFVPPEIPDGKDWIWLGILGSICTAYAFTASLRLLKVISPFTLILSINLEPVYGIILALLIFGEKEKMEWEFYAGALLIFLIVVGEGVLKYKQSRIRNMRLHD